MARGSARELADLPYGNSSPFPHPVPHLALKLIKTQGKCQGLGVPGPEAGVAEAIDFTPTSIPLAGAAEA